MKQLFLSCLCAFCISSNASSGQPNVIILFADDAGYMDFGFTGSDEFSTPRIDQFANEGVICTQGYVTASVCSPSRAGLLTGRYQQRFGHEANLRGIDAGLPLSEKTLADRLGKLGYTNCAIGKWHLGSQESMHPLARGFDEFHGFLLGSRTYFSIPENTKQPQRALMHNREIIPEEDNLYVTDWMAEKAIDFIKKQDEKPFFLYVAFNAVHTPMHAKPEDLSKFPKIENQKRKKLAAMTLALDRAVGNILDTVHDEGLDEQTIIFFINDNGGATINASNNGPLRGMKGSKWEGGIRVPFVVSWKNHFSPQRYNNLVSALDVAATAIENAGGEVGDDLDGVDLLPYFNETVGSELQPHLSLFWRRHMAAAVREGDWKLIRVEESSPMLFNIEEDLGETTNLAEKHPQKVQHMLDLLAAWESEMVDPLWVADGKWQENQIKKHSMDVIG
ncbi:MAG TPA: sulfatase-like hydrolase/transferase, partial [Phycisphaerales bacterium]|nr:sulfatase-like hydrolase/transferase [Phycisphaerales bacterium]